MKRKPKNFIIKLHLYPFDVMVSIDQTDDDLLAELTKYGNDPADCGTLLNLSDRHRGRCAMLPSNQTVIRLKRQPDPSDMAGLIAHETFHAVTFIMDRIGMKLKLCTSDEAYAYMMDYLIQRIHAKL